MFSKDFDYLYTFQFNILQQHLNIIRGAISSAWLERTADKNKRILDGTPHNRMHQGRNRFCPE